MSTKFLSPGWRMPRNANQSKQSNYSMDFDGTNYIDLGDNVPPFNQTTSKFSISFWLNRENTTSNRCVFENRGTSYNSGISLEIRPSNNVFYFWIYPSTGGGFITTFPISSVPINQWKHIAIVFDGTQTGNTNRLKIYVDNSSLTLTYTNNVPSDVGGSGTGDNFRLAEGLQANFQGKIDGFSMFNYPLSASQVTTLYGDSTNGPGNPMALPSPPKAYYPLGTSAWNGNFLAENNAIGDYVFSLPEDATVSTLNNFFNSTNFPDGFTASVWVKNWAITGSGGAPQNIFFNGANATNRFELYSSYSSESGFKVWLNVNSTPLYSNSANSLHWSDNTKWVNLVVTWDRANGTLVLYSNGQAGTINTSAPTSWGASNTNTTIFGNDANQSGNVLTSNYQMWNGPISSTEVETLYNYGSPIRTLANIPQNSNLKAWYKLDASEIYNSSSTEWSVDNNANTSTYDTSINLVRASSQKIDIANGSELDFTGDFTMSIWVNLTTSSNNMGVFNKTSQANTNGVSLFKRGGANFEFYVSEFSNVLTFASQGDNIWQQITITLNRTTGERIAYVNGEQAATLTHIKTFTFPNQGWDIGTFANNSPNYLDAKVSNFKLFNSVLSPTEVQTLYNNGTPLTDMSSFTSLQGWWKLNNLSSGLTDSSSNSNNATATSTTTEYPGFVNALAGDSLGMSQANLVQSDLQTVAPYSKYALSFDGTNDYIDCGNDSSLKLASNFSISVWMKSSNQQSFAVAVGNNSVFSLQMSATLNKFRFNVYSSGWQEAYYGLNPIDDDKWHHVVATHDGSTIKVYVDNVKGTDASAGAIPSNTAPFLIGYLPGNAGLYFDGQISNVSYWNTALTQAQVTETYNEGLPSDLNSHSAYSNLVSWWQLGSNSSWNGNRWIVADGKGTNNGYSQNMAPYMPESGLTNGVGTTANGTSTGMGVGALVGDAPYSTANAVSSGMAVTARGTDVP